MIHLRSVLPLSRFRPAIGRLLPLLVSGLAFLFVAFPSISRAAEIIDIFPSGSDVVAIGSGSVNTAALTNNGNVGALIVVNPQSAAIIIGSDFYTEFSGISGPSNFGTGGATAGTSSSGQAMGRTLGGRLILPPGYVSGSPLSATATWANRTLASLGLTPGTYVYTWGSGGTADSLTINVLAAAPPVVTSATVGITLSANPVRESDPFTIFVQVSNIRDQYGNPITPSSGNVVVNLGGTNLPQQTFSAGQLGLGSFVSNFSIAVPDDAPTGTASDATAITATVTLNSLVTSATANVTVNNSPPESIQLSAPAHVTQGVPFNFSGTFVDIGSLDTFVATIDWGDGTPNTVINRGAGQQNFSATHTYAVIPGAGQSAFGIGVSVVDDDTGTGTSSWPIFVDRPSLVVTTTVDEDNGISDPGVGNGTSLREALAYAATLGGAQTVTFSNSTANGAVNFHDGTARTIQLSGGQLAVNGNVTIVGPGADRLTVRGDWNGSTSSPTGSRIFNVASGVSAEISGLTMANGGTGGGSGGAIFSIGGVVTLRRCVVRDNFAISSGGGIYNQNGFLRVIECTITNNEASFGGGLLSTANSGSPRLLVSQSTVIGNRATSSIFAGGGIHLTGCVATITHCVIAGNSSGNTNASFPLGGAGVSAFGASTLTILNTLLVGNASPSGNPDFAKSANATFTDLGNLIGIPNGSTLGQILRVDGNGKPLLTSNGGPTPTVALVAGSPALDAGVNLTTVGSGGVDGSVTTIPVGDSSAFASGVTIQIESEQMVVQTVPNATSLTVTRGVNGTTAAAHAAGVAVNYATDQRGSGFARVRFSAPDIGAYEAGAADFNPITANDGALWYLGPPGTVDSLRVYREVAGVATWVDGGTAKQIGQAADGTIIVRTVTSDVYARLGSTTGIGTSWQALTKVVTGDGATWFLGPDGNGADQYIYRWAAGEAPAYSGGAGVQLSLASGVVRTTTANGSIYERTGSANGLGTAWTLLEGPSLVVTTINDVSSADGQTSLREALAYAATLGGAQTVTFSNTTANGAVNFHDGTARTITLGGMELVISSSVTLVGPGADKLAISGNDASRVFSVTSGTVSMSGLTITGGKVTGTGNIGGAGLRSEGNLSLTDCVLSNNNLVGSVGGNASLGGAIFTAGPLDMLRCAIVNNTASGPFQVTGGAIYGQNSSVTLRNCTLSGNVCSGGGPNFGGGICMVNAASASLTNCTISANSAASGGGIFTQNTPTTLVNTIVAGQTSGGDLNSALQPASSNNLIGGTPLLAALGNYGGPTPTMPPLPGSPAIDAGSDALAVDANNQPLTTDQRGTGFARMVQGRAATGAARVDIGAYEYVPAVVPAPTFAAGVAANGINVGTNDGPLNLAGPTVGATPAGGSFTGSGTGGTNGATFTPTTLVPGDYVIIYTTAPNLDGFTASAQFTIHVFDNTPPAVTGVSSTTADGEYRAGQQIAVTVSFTEPVTVTGVPQLALAPGGGSTLVGATGGSGTATLTFTYLVSAGDNTPDLDYASTTALALNGGAIKDAVGNDAVLTLPAPGAAGSLGANKNLLIDTTPPGIAIGAPSPAQVSTGPLSFEVTYGGADAITLTSADVTVNATGSAAAANVQVSGSGNVRTVTLSGLTGNGTLGISIAAETASDAAGNFAPAVGPSVAAAVDNVPTIATATPGTVLQNTAASVVLVGTNFLPGNQTVTFTPPGGPATPVTPTAGTISTMTVPLSANLLATTGQGTIRVQTAGGFATVNVEIVAPVIAQLSPGNVGFGAANQTVTVTGANFIVAGSMTATVRWTPTGGTAQDFPVANLTAASLTFTAPAALLTNAGTAAVRVLVGNAESAPATFTITGDAPVITAANPASFPTGPAARTVVLTGTEFRPGAQTATFTAPGGAPVALTIDASTATQLTVTIPAGQLVNAGTATITVTTGGGVATRPVGIGNPAQDDTAYVSGKKPFDIDVLANDAPVPGGNATITILTPPQHGTATVSGGKVTFTPNGALPPGGDTFTYQYDDGIGGVGAATVTVVNFVAIAGIYDGRIEDPTATPGAEAHQRAGYLRVTISKTGSFSGQVTFASQKLSPMRRQGIRGFGFSSKVGTAGDAVRIIVRRPNALLTLVLQFDAATGTITGTAESTDAGGRAFASPLVLAPRALADALAGKYTLLIDPEPTPASPQGTGFAAVTIKPTGVVSLTGRLADGAAFSSAASFHADRTFPLYAALYRGAVAARGSVRGTIAFPGQSLPMGDANGLLAWFKPERARDAHFPAGFALSRTALLGRYTPPARGTPVLAFAAGVENGHAILDQGGFPLLDLPFTLAPTHAATASEPNAAKLKLHFNARNGLFRGTFAHPATGRITPFAGAVLQADASGSGYFLGAAPTEAGAVDLVKK